MSRVSVVVLSKVFSDSLKGSIGQKIRDFLLFLGGGMCFCVQGLRQRLQDVGVCV